MATPFKSLAAALPRAAELEYVPPLVNPLTVSAGPNQTVSGALDGILVGAVSSYSTAAVTVEWTLVSGPGSATFGTPTATSTTVTVSEAGAYVFKLTATQGDWSIDDESSVLFTA
jgi:hypothetical protein